VDTAITQPSTTAPRAVINVKRIPSSYDWRAASADLHAKSSRKNIVHACLPDGHDVVLW
jgi:hypothetical protein